MESPWPNDVIDLSPSLLQYATEQELAELEKTLAMTSPGSFAQLSSHGKWRPALHLTYLDRAIMESLDQAHMGEIDGQLISMRSQHGNSELSSRYLPAWFLGKYPDRRVILTSYEADFAASWGRSEVDPKSCTTG